MGDRDRGGGLGDEMGALAKAKTRASFRLVKRESRRKNSKMPPTSQKTKKNRIVISEKKLSFVNICDDLRIFCAFAKI